jgi:hypothetical protein
LARLDWAGWMKSSGIHYTYNIPQHKACGLVSFVGFVWLPGSGLWLLLLSCSVLDNMTYIWYTGAISFHSNLFLPGFSAWGSTGEGGGKGQRNLEGARVGWTCRWRI